LEAKTHNKKEAQERQSIHRIKPGQAKQTWSNFLLTKATAVDDYRRQHAPMQLRERMEAASQLARKCATTDRYKITVHSAKNLADVRPTLLIVTANGKKFQTEKQEHTNPNWDKTESITWRPGDKIRIEWRYVGWYPDGPIAELESDALDSLKFLSGAVELEPSDKRGYLDQLKPPTVSLSIDGIKQEDWAAFKEFIYPGDYWGK